MKFTLNLIIARALTVSTEINPKVSHNVIMFRVLTQYGDVIWDITVPHTHATKLKPLLITHIFHIHKTIIMFVLVYTTHNQYDLCALSY